MLYLIEIYIIYCSLFIGCNGFPRNAWTESEKHIQTRSFEFVPQNYNFPDQIERWSDLLHRVKWVQKENLEFQETEDPLADQGREASRLGACGHVTFWLPFFFKTVKYIFKHNKSFFVSICKKKHIGHAGKLEKAQSRELHACNLFRTVDFCCLIIYLQNAIYVHAKNILRAQNVPLCT